MDLESISRNSSGLDPPKTRFCFSSFTLFYTLCLMQFKSFKPTCNNFCFSIKLKQIPNFNKHCLFCSCKTNALILMVVCGILAMITFVVNLTVLCVFCSYKTASQNSQILYKLSLAAGDLLVGLVVFPSCVSTLHYRLVAQREIIYVKSKNSLNGEHATFDDSISQSYLSAIGFFTTLSLTVSAFTLALAGFDRLNAIRDPIRYDRRRAASRAKCLLALIWVLAFVIAILPLFAPGLYPYSLIVGLLAATTEEGALYEYLIGFGLPLLAVWIVVGAIYYNIKRQRQINKKQRVSISCKATVKRERKVYKTLVAMLSAFTLSVAPTMIAVFAQMDPRIHEQQADVYDPQLAASWYAFELFAVLLLLCNSLWNFFIYSFREAKFRRMAAEKCKLFWNLCCVRKHFSVNSPLNSRTSVSVLDYRSKSTLKLNKSKSNFRSGIPSNLSSQSDY